MKNIYLIGLPGCGKTTIGVGLSDRFSADFLDLDTLIEFKEGRDIPLIFAENGEDYFRTLERQALLSIDGNNKVIATGGGAPCFFDNMDMINKNGLSVYLKISKDELFNRLHGKGASDRPLLAGKSDDALKKELKDKLLYREQFYNRADIVVEGDNLSVHDVYNAIIKSNSN